MSSWQWLNSSIPDDDGQVQDEVDAPPVDDDSNLGRTILGQTMIRAASIALQTEAVEYIYRSYMMRPAHIESITANDFENWQYENESNFAHLEVRLNLELVNEFFVRKQRATRGTPGERRQTLSIEERIAKGGLCKVLAT